MSNFKFSLLLSLVLILGSCSSTKYLVSDVTKHHNLQSIKPGQTFIIKQIDQQSDKPLAFESYAEIVAEYLEKNGLIKTSGENEDVVYIVTLNWIVDGPTSDITSKGSNFYSSFRYGNPYGFGYSLGYPYDIQTKTKQLYTRNVEIVIYEASSYDTVNPIRVFEGSASSTGSNAQINPVMHYIIQSIFEDFPGISGQTKTLRINIPPGSQAIETGGYSLNRAK